MPLLLKLKCKPRQDKASEAKQKLFFIFMSDKNDEVSKRRFIRNL